MSNADRGDKGRAAVYIAEWNLCDVMKTADVTENRSYDFYGSMLQLPIERKFASLDSIETYCSAVLRLAQVLERYPVSARRPVTVRHRRGDRAAHYERSGVIAINATGSRWALRELVVLHELAHHLTPGDLHWEKWRKAFVFLVTECIGPEVGIILYAFLDKELA